MAAAILPVCPSSQVEALERAAQEARQQRAPPAPRRVPTFGRRAGWQQQGVPAGAWPAAEEGIEDASDSDGEALPQSTQAAAAARGLAQASQGAAGGSQRSPPRAVPQLGLRRSLPVGAAAAADAAEGEQQAEGVQQAESAGGTQPALGGRRQQPGGAAAGHAGSEAVIRIDFLAVDVGALCPSVLLA